VNFSSVDDVTLLNMIAESSSEAIGALYDRYGRLVFTVAIHVVGDAETAEEITQDVFVRVWEGAKSYRAEMAKVSSWLISITRHRSIDELRRRGVRPEKNQMDWPEEEMNDLLLSENPEDSAEMVLQKRYVRQAIASLPIEQQKVLSLAYFKGYSHQEIAELMGEPLGTVKSRIRLAMLKLRDLFVEQGIVER